MSCEAFEHDLALLVSTDLPPEWASGIESHLAGCAACASRFEEYREMIAALAA